MADNPFAKSPRHQRAEPPFYIQTPRQMHNWRQEHFEQIATVLEKFSNVSELADYIEYLRLLNLGLRKEALKHIEDLLSTLRAVPVPRQRQIASHLCREARYDSHSGLLPHPLRARFIDPVMHDWKRAEPSNPEPFRWTCILDDLVRAVDLDPTCSETRCRMIAKILYFVGYAAHELPYAYCGDDLDEDRRLLRRARQEAELITDEKVRLEFLKSITEEDQLLSDYEKRMRDERGF